MNEDNIDDDLIVPDLLTSLKAKADRLGIQYHPSIGVDKLGEKVRAAMSDEPAPADAEPEAAPEEETLNQMRGRKRREANELVRIRVTCMNPAKRELEGELFTSGNSVVGSFTKFVPFNANDGWHVPRIIYNQIKERQCQVFYTVRLPDGTDVRKGKLIREFAVEILPDLTAKEIKELAQRQAMAKGQD